jgi:hypothetical protein
MFLKQRIAAIPHHKPKSGLDALPRTVAEASAGQREENDEAGECQYGNDKDAAFGASRSTAKNRLPHRMRCEEMMLNHGSAVSDAIEKRLAPVPRGVEPNRPP